MKDIRTWLIIALAGIILFMLFFKGNRKDIKNIQTAAKEREAPHFAELIELRKHKIATKHKMEIDSIVSKTEKVRYEKTISRLKKELKTAKFNGTASLVPDDSVQLGMDCLEREPIKDSIDRVRIAEIARLEEEKADLVKDYESIMDDNQAEKNELQAIINSKDQEIGELIKQAKKANRKGKLRLIEGAALGLIGGLAVGGLR